MSLTTYTPQANQIHSNTVINQLFAKAGIAVNGTQPWDIQIKDSRTYSEILRKWSLGLGEAYMAGYWDCESVDQFIFKLLDADIENEVKGLAKFRVFYHSLRAHLFNLQTPKRAFEVGQKHYDIGNDLFEKMLDPLMIYSCGYWQNATTLEKAQLDKLDLICRKLDLKENETLLEIGCGWGGLAYYAAKYYGVKVVGITVSFEQKKKAEEVCKGLPVIIEFKDYREISGQFDKIVSVGMFEHVGQKNYSIFFDKVGELLKKEGIFLLHTIGNYMSATGTDPWIHRYIFPNGKIPSAFDIVNVIEGSFLIEDWHNFGMDYDRTLMAWYKNFKDTWPEIRGAYDMQFYRMWSYYLLSCAGYFRSRQGQLWQLVLTKRKRNDIYRSVRFI